MKRFNKILALVLALTMMCGIVSICASAADTTNAAFKVRYVDNDGNAVTSVTAGSTVNVILSLKTNNSYSPIFAAHLYFDSALFSHIRQGGSAVQTLSAKNCGEVLGRFAETGEIEDVSDELLAHEDEIAGNGYVNDWGAGNSVAMAPHKDNMYPDSFTDDQKSQYKCTAFIYTANGGDSNITVNTEGEYVDFVRFRFLANADTEVNSSNIFLFEDEKRNYIMIDVDDEPLRNGQTSNPVKVSNLTIEYEGGVTPPAQDPISVENITTQVQWQSKDEGLMRVAFRGNIKNYTLNLVDGSETEIADISKMGVVYSKSNTDPTIDGANCTDVDAWTIYDFTTGGYFFRAVVGNYPCDNTETLYAKAYIIIDGQTIYAPSAMTTTGADAYAAGVANGMSAK